MNSLSKIRNSSILKWVFVNLSENNLRSSKTTIGAAGFYHIAQSLEFYSTKACSQSRNGEKSKGLSSEEDGNDSVARQEAQFALTEYLYSTRNLQYLDADNISRNAPVFLENLLKGVDKGKDVRKSVRKLLSYHPINEFEPFFESMGLKPSEYSKFLPRNLMYLTDDRLLLENYHVLCEYTIAPNRIGRIYKESQEVFRYKHGVLLSKLQSLEAVGFSQCGVAKLVASCPNILTDQDFFEVLEELKDVGIVNDWIEEHIQNENSYVWRQILKVLFLLKKFGFGNEQFGELLRKHPELLLEDSGTTTVQLIGFLLKFGASFEDIVSMFMQFPHITMQKFVFNLRNCYHFLLAIEMDAHDVQKIVCGHSVILGSCSLKKVNSLLNSLNSGKKRLCEIIKENPHELKKWVLGMKVKSLPTSKEDCSAEKVKFLVNLGFVENSNEMSKALKLFRGKTKELQERFDCLVNAGLSQEDVSEMLKAAPQILSQTKDVIKMKIDFLVNDLGYSISSLIAYPQYLYFSIQKVKLRFAMYKWLIEQGRMREKLALSTILAYSDKRFVQERVRHHPQGVEVWEKLKKQFCPERV